MRCEAFWWNCIPGPSAMAENMGRLLLQGRSLFVPTKQLVWPEALCESVEEWLRDADNSLDFQTQRFDDGDDVPLRDLVLALIPRGDVTYYPSMDFYGYVSERTKGMNMVIWMQGVPENRAVEARTLCAGIAGRKCGIRLVCETPDVPPTSRNVSIVFPERFITTLDILQLSLNTVSRTCGQRPWTEYLGWLICTLAGFRVDLVDRLAEAPEALLLDPVGRCRDLLPQLTEQEIRQAVWDAQIRVVYPMIQRRRLRLIARNRMAMSELLPFQDEWHNTVIETEGLEMGHISFFVTNGQLELCKADQDELRLLRSMRNELSHCKCLDWEILRRFFGIDDSALSESSVYACQATRPAGPRSLP